MKYRMTRMAALVMTLIMAAAMYAVPASALQPVFEPSSSYAGGEYYRRLLEVELTGDPRTDIVNIALSQMGYKEGGMEGEYAGQGVVCNNFTEYGYSFGDPDCIWCTTFIWWCARQAGVDSTVFPDTIWPRLLAVNCPYVGYSPSAVVRPGDILFVENSGDTTSDHLALVVEVTDTRILTVEGNCGNAVAGIAYERDIGARPDGLGTILYIGYPNYERDPSIPDASSMAQYALMTHDADLFNKHTGGRNQGRLQAGQICRLLAVRNDGQWYQIECGDYAYWLRAENAIVGRDIDELNQRYADMVMSSVTTTTTSAFLPEEVTTATEDGISMPQEPTTPVTSEGDAPDGEQTTLADGIDLSITTTYIPSFSEDEQPQYTVYVTPHDEAAAYEKEQTDWLTAIGGPTTLVIYGMLVLVVIIIAIITVLRARSGKR